uniref:Uncharacterized protein n=1 Tax=Anguilla anguilla TaxID=7936 RepID=A0A0E9WZP1_ANGAN
MILRLPGPFYRGKDTYVLVNFHREKAEQTIWNRLEQRMQRGYTREAYLELVANIWKKISEDPHIPPSPG